MNYGPSGAEEATHGGGGVGDCGAAAVTGIVSHVQLSFANILQHIRSSSAAAAAASDNVLVKRKHKVTKVTQV